MRACLPAASALRSSPGGDGCGGNEYKELAAVKASFAIASSRGLGDRVQTGHSAIDHWEVDVHTGFDELGAYDPYRLPPLEAFLDLSNHSRSVLAAHQRRQMDRSFAQ